MKKSIYLLLAASALMGIIACGKVDPEADKKAKELQQYLEDRAVECVLSSLTGKTDAKYEGQTYAPVYGTVLDESNPGERSVKVQSAAYSEGYFRSIAGGSSLIKETSDGLILDLTGKKFGKLTYHSGSGTNVGYVDVEIPCVPSLAKISYKTNAQWGENDEYPYQYRFGDVVKDGDNHYFLVVREPDSSWPGAMIRLMPGRGDNFSYFKEDQQWGPWLYNNNYSMFYEEYPRLERKGWQLDYEAFYNYVVMCQDPDFRQRKQKIIDATNREVFPEVALWNGDSEFVTGNFPGFATMLDGYAHEVGSNEINAIKLILNCEDYRGSYVVEYARLSGDGKGTPSCRYGFYEDEQSFKKAFYEGSSIAVYTAHIELFSKWGWYGEKVDL